MCNCFLKLTMKKTEQCMNLFNVNNKDLTTLWGISSKLTIKTLHQCMKIVQSNIKYTIKMCEICSKSTISTLEICFIRSKSTIEVLKNEIEKLLQLPVCI